MVVVIIAAPLVHAFAHVVQSEVIGLIDTDSCRTVARGIGSDESSLRGRLVTPRIKSALPFAACRPLPLGFSRQAKPFSRLRAQPTAISNCVIPSNTDDGLLRL